MLTELLSAHGDFVPGRWTPCPPVERRECWDALPSSDRWLAEAGPAMRDARRTPPLTLSLWTDFTRTGRRDRYEHAYFARRRTLCRLVMAECTADTGVCLPAIADCLWAICEESAWQLPAHNSYIRDTPQLPLPDPDRPVVDLFAAETAALLAMVHYLLGRQLDAAYPGLDARLRRETDRRVLKPWANTHFWWMGNGSEPMCNWTTWCTQNCLIAEALF
ncbi:MAG: heparinase, partial [Gemmiger sp.]